MWKPLALLPLLVGCGTGKSGDDTASNRDSATGSTSATSGTPAGTTTGSGSVVGLPTGTPTGTPAGTVTGLPTGTPGGSTTPTDSDGDGFLSTVDCDDTDPSVFPGAVEVCDGRDTDCDPATADQQLASTGGQAFTTIQAAIDAALVGEVVSVCPGTYPEALVISQDLVLAGISGAGATIVDAAGAGSVVQVDGGAVSIEGLTLTGGIGTDISGTRYGGGIYAEGASSITVLDCTIDDNTADTGGGLYGSAAGPTVIRGTTVSANAAADGGGVHAPDLTLDTVLLVGNTATRGGGFFVPAFGVAYAVDSDLSANEASDRGGGAMVSTDAVVTLERGTWDGNTSDRYAAGLYLDQRSSLGSIDTLFDNNQALDKGGAFYAVNADVVTAGTRFVGNVGSWGGVGFLFFGSTLAATDTEMSYNSGELGGALFVNLDSSAVLTDSLVQGGFSLGGGGAWLSANVTLESQNTDWGAGALANIPDDVGFAAPGGYFLGFGAGATFTCSTTTNQCQ